VHRVAVTSSSSIELVLALTIYVILLSFPLSGLVLIAAYGDGRGGSRGMGGVGW